VAADSLFPFIDATVADIPASTTATISQEYNWDFDANEFILTNGKPTIVTGSDALKIWITKALSTQRYCFPAYTWNYGQEFESLVGQGLSAEAMQSEAQRYLTDVLLINPHITSVKDVSITLDGSKTTVTFTAVTDQGEVNISGI
jgi:hypothetical protein